MALTKLPKSGIADDAIDTSKIEDGTIQAVEVSGTIPAEKLSSTQDYSSKTVTLPDTSVTSDQLAGSIANAKLSNSTFTVRGTSRSLGDSFSLGVNVDWQSVITGAGSSSTAAVGNGYFIDTTSDTHTLNLPTSASIGDQIAIKDYAGTFATNNLTIGRNGHNIQGVANDTLISTNRASLVLVYVDSTKGWLYTDEHNVADLGQATFTAATGGTVSTSGDYKLHVFTGDGCFAVSSVGNNPANPLGGPNTVEYLVVGGGGAGGGDRSGGGGGGGVRTNFPSPSGLAITAITYPVSVGGGAAGSGDNGARSGGSPSSFSTITTSGGGGGGAAFVNNSPGGPGGSGGGGAGPEGGGGSGNQPPVSPPQGSPGGYNTAPLPGLQAGGGGGGGAAGTGGNGNGSTGGNGGNGTQVPACICPPSIGGPPGGRYFGAGGGGGRDGRTGGSGGSGGTGGGTAGQSSANPSTPTGAGPANSGAGTGGMGVDPNASSGNGGKGVVIIRYKFQ